VDARKEAAYKEKCRNVITVLSSNSARLTANFSKVDEIFNNYEIYKKHIHNNMKCRDTYTKTEPLMDNHKIAAAFFCSFLKSRPLTYIPDDSGVSPDSLELRANEQGAFLFGLQIVQDFWADKFIDCVTAEEREIYQKVIHLPETSDGSYIHWFIKLVIDGINDYFDYKNEKYEEKLIFFIAHIYFMIEQYSYQYYKAKLYESRSEAVSRELLKSKNS
jgi:hypothetical protein